jgi:translocon-associated protein subunit gamma
MPPKMKITREEELLLEGFNKNVSTKSSALFYGNAFIVSAIPVWLYWRVHSVDMSSYAIMFVIGTLVSTWLLAFAYKNTKHVLKHKLANKREAAVAKEMNAKVADDKKISKKERDERILWKKNEVAEYEATTFSIFYNNSMFLAIVILASFYIFARTTPSVNYLLSIGGASGIIALLSTGSSKN